MTPVIATPPVVLLHGGKLRGTRFQFPEASHDVPANRAQYALLAGAHAAEAGERP